MNPVRCATAIPVALVALAALFVSCGPDPAGRSDPTTVGITASGTSDTGKAGGGASAAGGPIAPLPSGRRVLAISVDGLAPEALRVLGRRSAPSLWTLLDEGAGTLDARTAYEQTVTLPNHVGMLTGRPIEIAAGGHGVVRNDDVAGPVVPAGPDGAAISSALTEVADSGGSSAVFSGKAKFEIFARTWPDAVDVSVIDPRLSRLGRLAAQDLGTVGRALTFLHLADPDLAGHRAGWLAPPYLRAVRRADTAIGRMLDTIRDDPALRRSTVVVLTADHGGTGRGHEDAAEPANYTIPFVVWGAQVPTGDLYELAPGLTDPGDRRPSYDEPAPVRNCDLANVATTLLGLGPVPGSGCTAASEMTRILGDPGAP